LYKFGLGKLRGKRKGAVKENCPYIKEVIKCNEM